MYQICISGAAKGPSVEAGKDLAHAAGRAVSSRGHVVMTGATTGLPQFAAEGAKQERGQSIGISPAPNRYSHVHDYKLPVECYDVIFYTGLDFIGRDVLLITTSNAVICVGGRMGTTHEFAVAMELQKPVGILKGAGGTSDYFDDLIEAAGREYYPDVIFDDDPEKLVDRMIKLLDEKQADLERYHAKLHLERQVP